jgi:hypothetical protein
MRTIVQRAISNQSTRQPPVSGTLVDSYQDLSGAAISDLSAD